MAEHTTCTVRESIPDASPQRAGRTRPPILYLIHESDESAGRDMHASKAAAGPAEREAHEQEPAPQHTPLAKVMVVDDERAIIRIIHVNFELRGFAVYDCPDSSAAQEMAAEVLPDVVILDLLMPNKSGWEVLSELKASESTKDIPVIVLSVMTLPTVQEEVKELGAASYVAKPFDLNALFEEVKRVTGLD